MGFGTGGLAGWVNAILTAGVGLAVGFSGLMIDYRAAHRQDLELVLRFVEICYEKEASDEARIAAKQMLDLIPRDRTWSPTEQLLGLDQDPAAAELSAYLERLQNDPNGCGALLDREAAAAVAVATPSPQSAVSAEKRSDVPASAESVDAAPTRLAETYALHETSRDKLRTRFFPRVFVHVPRADGKTGKALRRSLAHSLKIDGAPVTVPGVERVAVRVSSPQLRFLKADDHEDAADLARQIGRTIGAQVTLIDLSGRYEDDPRVRPRTFELWLPNGWD